MKWRKVPSSVLPEGGSSSPFSARKHGISWYDASYVELMVRLRAPLKSFDEHILGLKDAYPLIL